MGIWENHSLFYFSLILTLWKTFFYLLILSCFHHPSEFRYKYFLWVFMSHDNAVISMSLNKNLSFQWYITGQIDYIIKAILNGWYLRIHFIQYDMASPQSPLRAQIKLVFGPMPTSLPRQTVSCPLLYTVPALQIVRKPLTCKKRREEYVHICKHIGETWHKWI